MLYIYFVESKQMDEQNGKSLLDDTFGDLLANLYLRKPYR